MSPAGCDHAVPASKHVYALPQVDTRHATAGVAESTMFAINASLQQALSTCKDQITRIGDTAAGPARRWDTSKKLTNDYELMLTAPPDPPGVSTHAPISRSFFKLWEILHDFEGEAWHLTQGPPVRAAFLAEGPGGFMEAFARLRATRGLGGDELHGMTLVSRHRNVPGWRVAGIPVAPGTRTHLHRGADDTGDLYRVHNIDALAAQAGEASCDIVTADGGFDFSADFNNQEEVSLPLLACEAYAALRLQRRGGAFVMKVYDLHAPPTLRLLHVLRSAYAEMRVVKPLTSRPANSEKYVVLWGFRGAPAGWLAALRAACTAQGSGGAAAIEHELRGRVPISGAFLHAVVHCNAVFALHQACAITRTLHAAVVRPGAAQRAYERARVRTQLEASVRWCHKYSIRVNPRALLDRLQPRPD